MFNRVGRKTLKCRKIQAPADSGVLNIGGLSLGIEYISIVMFTGLSDEVYTNP